MMGEMQRISGKSFLRIIFQNPVRIAIGRFPSPQGYRKPERAIVANLPRKFNDRFSSAMRKEPEKWAF